MNIVKLSASSWKNYNACEMAFFIEQCLGIRFDSPWKSTHRGSILHEVMEAIAHTKKAAQEGKEFYEKEGIGRFSSDYENLDIDDLVSRVYNDYIVKKPEHKWTKYDLKDIKEWTHKIMSHRGGIFNPLKRNIIDIERRFAIELEHDWAKIDGGYLKVTGFIDLVVNVDEEENSIEIIDWKSSKYTKDFHTGEEITYSKLQNDIQLLLYHYACKEIYGQDKNILTTIYYFNNKIGPQTLHLEDNLVGEMEEKIRRQFEKIRSNNNPKQSRSYKCRKFCPFGMHSFAEVGRKPMQQFLRNGIADYGEDMTICDEIHLSNNKRGLGGTIEEYKKEK